MDHLGIKTSFSFNSSNTSTGSASTNLTIIGSLWHRAVKARFIVLQISLFQLRSTHLPKQQSLVKIESYMDFDCASHILIFFEHGITSIRDYVLIEIMAELIQESLDDYFQTVGLHHLTCQGNQIV